MGRLLIVDDEPNLRRVLTSDLHLDGHVVEEAEGVAANLNPSRESLVDRMVRPSHRLRRLHDWCACFAFMTW